MMPSGVALTGDLDITAGGSVTIGQNVSSEDVFVNTIMGAGMGSRDILISSDINANGTIDLLGGGAITVTEVVGGTTDENEITTTNGTGDDTIFFDAMGDVNITRNINSNNRIVITSDTGNITINDLAATPASLVAQDGISISADAGNVLVNTDNTSALQFIDIEATLGDVTTGGTNSAFTDIDITAGQNATPLWPVTT